MTNHFENGNFMQPIRRLISWGTSFFGFWEGGEQGGNIFRLLLCW